MSEVQQQDGTTTTNITATTFTISNQYHTTTTTTGTDDTDTDKDAATASDGDRATTAAITASSTSSSIQVDSEKEQIGEDASTKHTILHVTTTINDLQGATTTNPINPTDPLISSRSSFQSNAPTSTSTSTPNPNLSISNNNNTKTNTNDSHNDRPWDHSNRKVLIQGVDKFHDVKTATKVVNQWLERIKSQQQQQQKQSLSSSSSSSSCTEFVIDKIKKPPNSNWLLVTLQTETMVQPFIQCINTCNLRNRKGNNIYAKIQSESNNSITVNDDDDSDTNNSNSESKKRRRLDNNEITRTSNTTPSTRRPITLDELKDKIIPLWKLSSSIEEQQQHKMKEMIKKCAMKIIIDIKSKFRALEKEKSRTKIQMYPWILQKRCIDVQTIVSAPTPLRNKCELTFGYQYSTPTTNIIPTVKPNDGEITDMEENDKTTVPVPPTNSVTAESSKVPAVGFMVTGWSGGVAYSNELPNIPNEINCIVDMINTYLLSSPFVPYDVTTHTGFWRILTIRISRRTKECMIIIQHSSPKQQQQYPPSSTSEPDASIETIDWNTIFEIEKQKIIAMLADKELSSELHGPSSVKVTSIYFQEFVGLSNPPPEHPVQHAYGKTYLTEQLGNCMFQISPGAFFQVNTEGAEILYKLVVDQVREVTSPNFDQSLLFDVCCGTGTIGLTCLKAGVVGQVVGVDISEPAITDAKRNAQLNGYSTGANESNTNDTSNDVASSCTKKDVTRFVASRAEQVLGREIQNAKQQTLTAPSTTDTTDNTTNKNVDVQFIAVVDPAREGLHADVIKAIRSNQRIRRLIYVSCNPTVTLVRDATLLCTPPTKRYTGRPFRISYTQPVDMFPLTNHCEMIMTFDRLTEEEMH